MGNSHPYIMNFLILAACVAVSASQQLVTYPNGAQVPALTPEVAAATAAHLGALPYAAGYPYAAGFPYAAGYGYAAPLVAHAHGAIVPVDTAEVTAANAEFAAAGGVVNAAPYAAAYAYGAYPYAHGAYPYASPLVAHANGAIVPVDTVEVANAKAEFAAAGGVVNAAPYAAAFPYAAAGAYAYGAYPYAHGAFPYATPLVAHPNGAVVPVEPIDVVEARAAH